jgi:hypothetical protein
MADFYCHLFDVEAIVAGYFFPRHLFVGPSDTWRAGARLDGLTGRVTRSGKDVPVPANLEANIGEILGIVQHVADVTAALGDGLRLDQIIICGSLTPPQFLEATDSGIELALEPIGTISVRFAA